MHITRAFAVVTAATMAATLTAGPASASPPDHAQNATTYHGTWEGGIVVLFEYDEEGAFIRDDQGRPVCSTVSTAEDPVTVGGRWNVLVKQDGTALMGQTVFVDGRLHAAWGAWPHEVDYADSEGARVFVEDHTMTISEAGAAFSIPSMFGSTCDAVLEGTWRR